MRGTIGAVVAVAALGLAAPMALAVSYASGVVDLGGGMYSFVLNEDAAGVKIQRTGDTPLNLGALPKGTHTFSIGSGTAFSIDVWTMQPPGWTQISDDALTQSKYYLPRGVALNRNPASSNFGRIYVAEGQGGTTASGRTTTDGLYVMTADQGDITGQGNAAWTGGIDWVVGGSNSPFRMMVGPDDSVYIADWSDAHSGIWVSPADGMGVFSELLDNTGRQASGLVPGLHGSIPGLWVEGTGAARKLYTLDEDLNAGSTTGSVLRYDIGTTVSGYNIPPVEETEDDVNIILNLRADLVRDEDGTWWVSQYRSTETVGAPALTRWQSGGQAPIYNSAADDGLAPLLSAYGSLDIHDELDLLVMGARSGRGIYIIDISDPTAPVLVATIPQTGFAQDVAFDAAGNVYVVSNSTETLRIWSPGGSWRATTGSDGSFTLVPEPSSLALLALGGLALLARRR